ncbi:hypothetical protein predicted by Glimmer/Critica [Lactiplantibacillus plantarum]|nr:hypothetical protein predicted by Glimmer/Critica [Lactiplantibacillus plantarum]
MTNGKLKCPSDLPTFTNLNLTLINRLHKLKVASALT